MGNDNNHNTDGDTIIGDGLREDNLIEVGSQEDKTLKEASQDYSMEASITFEQQTAQNKISDSGIFLAKLIKLQQGILRTNCIDCLDRTNVAQYAYGLAALGHQLHALHLIQISRIDLDSPLADDLMSLYERMGDTLALQYGGSPAHNKVCFQIHVLFQCSEAKKKKSSCIKIFLCSFKLNI